MKIALIVAMDRERGIGKNNDLMWRLPDDMQFFKEQTKGHIVVMGRKNYDSIPEKFRPLPGRQNVVLTRNEKFNAPGCLVFHRLEDCLTHFSTETERKIFIIGGGEIYKIALEMDCVDEMFLTQVDHVYGADTFFPAINESEWKRTTLGTHPADERHASSFEFLHFERLGR